jgi:hypothetical protein
MKKYLMIVPALFIYSSSAWATEEIGLEILDTCLSERKAMMGDPVSSVRYGLCLGYLKGVADSLNGRSLCLPEDADTAQLTQVLKRVFLDYAKDHQEQLKMPAKFTVIPALQRAFPCKEQ